MARDPHLRGRPFPLIRIFGRTVRPERLFLVGFAVLATVLGASLAWGLVTSRSDLPGACGGGLALGSPACLSWNTEPADIAGYEIRVALGARDEQRAQLHRVNGTSSSLRDYFRTNQCRQMPANATA